MKSEIFDDMNQKIIKRSTSKDVANLAGVSRATVSAYINGTRYVSPQLKKRIQDAISKLNYTPNELARSLKIQDTKTIGLIIPALSEFFMPMLNSINNIIHAQNYSYLLGSSDENPIMERKMIEIFISKRISGIIIIPCSEENRNYMNNIKNTGTPIVQVNRRIIGLETDFVISKDYDVIYKATEYLINKGRKNIVLVGYNLDQMGEREKKYGYEAAVKDRKIDSHIVDIKGRNPLNIFEELNKFFIKNKKIDGMICTSQMRTSVALQFLQEKSINIPKDISFIGWGDSSLSVLFKPPLTMISENLSEIGKKATTILMDRIKKKNTRDTKSIILDVDFIIRESC